MFTLDKVIASKSYMVHHHPESNNMVEYFKVGHSTQTALPKNFNDIVLSIASGFILVLMDFSAAFDTIDYNYIL